MPRAIWKGVIRFGEIAVPVKLFSAVEDRGIHFRLLHARDLVPLEQRMVDPDTGHVVPADRIRRGFPLEDGTFVVLDEDELTSLRPPPSCDIEITRFVETAAIGRQWLNRPYYLGPDEDAPGYAALAEALRKAGRAGVARWVMRNKEYRGAVWSAGRLLMLITMRATGEVIPAEVLPRPSGRELEEKELAMAEQLVAALEDTFDPAAYQDTYRARVLELIEAKASGKVVELAPARPRPEKEKSLARALEESVRLARKARARRAA